MERRVNVSRVSRASYLVAPFGDLPRRLVRRSIPLLLLGTPSWWSSNDRVSRYAFNVKSMISYLTVRKPEDGQPQEDLTGLDSTSNLIDPCIVKGHPSGLCSQVARLSTVPQVGRRQILVGANRVQRPSSFHCKAVELECFDQNISLRRLLDVVFVKGHHEKRAEDEQDCRQEVR